MKKCVLLLLLSTALNHALTAQNVGIGTTTPADKLTVQTLPSNYGLTHTDGTIKLSTYVGGSTNGGWLGTQTNHSLNFFANNSAALLSIIPNGNVGIGITSPVSKLHITHAGPTAHLILEHPTLNNYSRLLFANTGASRNWGIAGKIGTGNNVTDILSFYNSSNNVDVIAMTGNGYVGIGAPTPTNKLQVGNTGGYSGFPFAIGNGSQAMAFDQGSSTSTWQSSTDISIFPNANVGIMTSTPTNKLQVGSVGATGFASNDLAIGNGTQAMAIYQSNTSTLIASSTDLVLMPRNNAQGRVGINTNTPRAPLDVVDASNVTALNGFYSYLNSTSADKGIGGTSSNPVPGVSIIASGRVYATEFDAYSDARIKHILDLSNTAKDLETLNSLSVTDYTMRDKVKYGNTVFKKVIAQDVEKVYPQVVSKHTDFIPNVYAVTSKIEKTAKGYSLNFANKHNISKGAKKLKVLLSEGESMQQFDIVSVPSESKVIIKANDIKADKAFVYGEEVDDFRTVDYEGLTTLNISATQELSKIVKKQQAAIDALTEEIKRMKVKGFVSR